MTITSRPSSDNEGYRHTCFICGYKWLSDAREETQCPQCSKRRSPTTKRLASLARGDAEPTDRRRSTTSVNLPILRPEDAAAAASERAIIGDGTDGTGDESDDDQNADRSRSGSDRALPVNGAPGD
ncbi:MAG: hypothetical protein AB7K09_05460 [Planctomycetota bacterium]